MDAKVDEELEEYLANRIDWTVNPKPLGPLDEQAKIRSVVRQAYRIGLEDGLNGR